MWSQVRYVLKVVLGTSALLALGAASPAVAGASTAIKDGTGVLIQGGDEVNQILTGTGLLGTGIKDLGPSGIQPGDASCTQIDPTMVACGSLANVRIDADLGGGHDWFRPGLTEGRLAELAGGSGNDELNGDANDNKLWGDEGADFLAGAGGSDYLDGGPGSDEIHGDTTVVLIGGGDDVIWARDGEQDQVLCGPGYDEVAADPIDVIEYDAGADDYCEVVDRGDGGGGNPPAPPPPPGPGAVNSPVADTTVAGLVLGGKKIQKTGKSISVVVSATSEDLWASATGGVSVQGAAKSHKLRGVKNRFVARGKKATLKLTVPTTVRNAIRRALRRHKKVTAKIKLTARDAARNTTTRKRTIRLKR